MLATLPILALVFLLSAGILSRPLIDKSISKQIRQRKEIEEKYKIILNAVKFANCPSHFQRLTDDVIDLFKKHKKHPGIKRLCGQLSVEIESKRLSTNLNTFKNVSRTV